MINAFPDPKILVDKKKIDTILYDIYLIDRKYFQAFYGEAYLTPCYDGHKEVLGVLEYEI